MNLDFKNKNVLVTGASRGIGSSIAFAFAQAGARIALNYASSDERAQEVLKTLPGSGHGLYKFDVAQADQVEGGIEKILKDFGSLQVVVNNAGITRDQILLRMKEDDWDQVMQTNLKSVFLVTRLAVKSMLKARHGSIINVSSIIGQTGQAGQSNYAAAKAGIIAFTKSIALEVASRSIRINCIAPGFIETDMTKSLSEDVRKGILDRVPMGSMGKPEDIAGGCLFLASPLASYITGHTLDVNGGLLMN
ncbi:MAG: 3-oxoacyl-[acyl-carrier-protein] reductase [Oligoflexia bacterium]|nr:3-oxoacyl-[acyl-carrier-protein] reductase [Oligoflexia bacterium]